MGIENPRSKLRRALFTTMLAAVVLVLPPSLGAEPFVILSQNMNRLFDNIDNGNNEEILTSADFHSRVAQAAQKFAEDYSLPQVIALQEVENENVVQQIADLLNRHYATDYRVILIPGLDISSINLAFLVQSDIKINKIDQLFREQRLPYDRSPLFSRPPLYIEVCQQTRCLSLLNLHLRSMLGINSAGRGERVARKRLRQAEAVAVWANLFQKKYPQSWLIVLGDFNALTPADNHVDVAGIIRGSPDNSRSRLLSRDLLNPDLIDLTRRIPAQRRYSYIYRQKKQQLDYMYANQPLANAIDGIVFGSIDYSFSDHAGLLAWYSW